MRNLKYKAIGIAILTTLSVLESGAWPNPPHGSLARGADAVEILRLRGARVLDAKGWDIIDANGTRAATDTVITRRWVQNSGITGREYMYAKDVNHVRDALRRDASGTLQITISRIGFLGRYHAWTGSFEEMARLAELENVARLHLDVVLSGPDDLAFLSDVKGLKQLALYLSGEIHESSLASLAHCRDVRSLTIFSLKKMNAECLKPIAAMDVLESVQIAVMRLDPIVVDYLCQQRQLRSVTLSGIRLTDEACRKLGEMPNLEELQLNGAGMSDEGRAIFRQGNQRAILR